MYYAETTTDVAIDIDIEQGERGIIDNVSIATTVGTFSLNAVRCFKEAPKDENDRSAWQTSTPEAAAKLSEYVTLKQCELDLSAEIMWHFTDPKTNISVAVTCSAHQDIDKNGKPVGPVYVERLGVQVEDSNVYYFEQHKEIAGFCVDNEMPKNGTYDHTTGKGGVDDRCIDELKATMGQTQLNVTRQICNDISLQRSGLDKCLYEFCQQYSLNSKFNGDNQACYDAIFPPEYRPLGNYNSRQVKSYVTASRETFCNLIAPADMEDQCNTEIKEADGLIGFGQARVKYLTLLQLPDPDNCIEKWDDLPEELPQVEDKESGLLITQTGVLVQYYDEDDLEWKTLKAIPQNSLCKNPVRWKFTCDKSKYRPLFENQIRFIQQKPVFQRDDDRVGLLCPPTKGVKVKLQLGEMEDTTYEGILKELAGR